MTLFGEVLPVELLIIGFETFNNNWVLFRSDPTHTHTHTHTLTHTHTHTHTHNQTHLHKHTQKQKHTHTHVECSKRLFALPTGALLFPVRRGEYGSEDGGLITLIRFAAQSGKGRLLIEVTVTHFAESQRFAFP